MQKNAEQIARAAKDSLANFEGGLISARAHNRFLDSLFEQVDEDTKEEAQPQFSELMRFEEESAEMIEATEGPAELEELETGAPSSELGPEPIEDATLP